MIENCEVVTSEYAESCATSTAKVETPRLSLSTLNVTTPWLSVVRALPTARHFPSTIFLSTTEAPAVRGLTVARILMDAPDLTLVGAVISTARLTETSASELVDCMRSHVPSLARRIVVLLAKSKDVANAPRLLVTAFARTRQFESVALFHSIRTGIPATGSLSSKANTPLTCTEDPYVIVLLSTVNVLKTFAGAIDEATAAIA